MKPCSKIVSRVALWLGACLLLAACGVPLPGSAGDNTIVFGATIPITGPKAQEGKYTRDGYMLYIDTVNRQGGIVVNGTSYKVKLQYYDDRSDPERVAALYTKLITEDKVNFLLGPYSSALTVAAVPVAEQRQALMVAAHGSAESIYSPNNRYTFSIVSPAQNYLRGIIAVVLAQDPQIKTVALLGANDVFSQEAVYGAATYAREKGLQVVYQGFYPLNTTDMRAALQAVKQRAPDLLLAAGHLQDEILLVRQAKALDLNPKAMGFTSGPSTPEFRANLQADADYIFGATQWTSALQYNGDGLWPTPRAYSQAFLTAYPDYQQVPYQTAESTAGLLAYQRAIEQAGSLDKEAVRVALSRLDLMTFYGRIKFDARGINIYKPMAVEQWQPDGRKYTVFPANVAEKAALYPMPPWNQR